VRAFFELLVLLAGAAAVYLAGSASTPFYTKGEPREALVVREVLRTGDWLVPRRPDGALTRKPPLYYWAAAGATAATPEAPEWAARLPSAVGAVLGLLAVWATARVAFGAAAALPAALVLATSLEWVQSATRARIDMTLAAPLAVLLLVWVCLTLGRSVVLSTIAVGAATAAVLAKGPVGIVLPALAAGLAWLPNVRRFGLVRFAIPLALAAVLAGLWYGVAYLDQGRAFLDVVLTENFGRFINAQVAHTGHVHGVTYLLALGLAGLLPWTPVAPLAATTAREWRRPPVTMLWAWAVAVPAFFALASSKRVEYLLPAFPALAVLLGAGLTATPSRLVARIVRLLALLYVPGLALVAIVLLLYGTGVDPAVVVARWLTPRDATMMAALADTGRRHAVVLVALAAGALAAAGAVERLRRREDWHGLALVLGVFFLASVGVFQEAIHPAIARSQSVRGFLHTLEPRFATGEPVYAFKKIDQQIRFYGPPTLVAFPPGGLDRPGLLLAWQRDVDDRRDAAGNPLEVLARDGVSAGRHGPLCLVRVPPGPLHRIDVPRRTRKPPRPPAQNG
jgi:hypothetical protein